MTDTDEVLRYMDEAASRTNGEPPSPGFDEPAAAPAPEMAVLPHFRGPRHHLEVAWAHADFGGELPKDVRLRPLKQAIRTAGRPVTSYQVVFNREIVAAVASLATDAEARESAMQAAIATSGLAVDDLAADVERIEDRLAEVANGLAARNEALSERTTQLEQQLEVQRTETRILRAKLEMVFRTAREALPGPFDEAQLTSLSRELSSGYDDLYRDLENVFRGSRDAIREQAEEYVGDVAGLATGTARVLDIGCGRGEWLEALRDHDVAAYGVDTNARFVEDCRARGLDVTEGDALAHLAELPESSLAAVTGFHIAEHLALDTLVQLADRALAALRPGGLLIFETPNPTNLNVGAAQFYLDPTHLRPLHPHFLEFLLLSRGFGEVEVRFLHGGDQPALPVDPDASASARRAAEAVNWSLFGPLDYAVLARKAAPSGPSAD